MVDWALLMIGMGKRVSEVRIEAEVSPFLLTEGGEYVS